MVYQIQFFQFSLFINNEENILLKHT